VTITNEQILALRSKAVLEIKHQREIVDACTDALIHTTKHPNDPDYPEEITRGRARCAEILQQQALS
jgi:hypothetical protein